VQIYKTDSHDKAEILLKVVLNTIPKMYNANGIMDTMYIIGNMMNNSLFKR